ncbi:RING/Ubox like zinc-binding domain-containing protein [Syncephalis plumigaleata]|nr:RING/Ubox like zinc-binding domain-containing protein [Syncephalis plumigaleata]
MEEDAECPLCLEEIHIMDWNFKPCECGYRICGFCWNHIKQNLNGLCPACRRPYSDDMAKFKPLSKEEIARIKQEKRAREQARKENEATNRRNLAGARVVQRSLVYVIGLSPRVANEETLRGPDFFGQFGKIAKLVINRRQVHPSGGLGVYVTFASKDDAAQCVQAVDGSRFDGRTLRAAFGTTKYCANFLRNLPCQSPGCMYLHELATDEDAYNKEEVASVSSSSLK